MNLVILLVLLTAGVTKQCYAAEKKTYRRSFINHYPRYEEYFDGGDPGQPLFLTPLIEKGKINEARQSSKVLGSKFLNVESYSGYLTVDKAHNSNLFFWYFPAEKNAAYAPVVIWLQGGPGASSLFGLFVENGPFEINASGHLHKREYSWSKTQNMIYIDNPVGTGFSFTENDDGYAKNEKDVGRNLYEAVGQLYKLFDFTSSSGFWVTGESYGGKYVPALAFHIMSHEIYKIPLKGVAIGNGLSDPLHQLKYGDYLYQLGLIDLNGLQLFHMAEKKGVACIKNHDMECAFNEFDKLINMDQSPEGSIFHNLTGYDTYFNYLHPEIVNSSNVLGQFLQSSDTRRAIHVGNMTFHDLDQENKVELHLKNDIMDTVAPWISQLLDSHRVCIYNGQLDIIVAYPLTVNYLHNLKFKGSELYKINKRHIWRVDGEIAGYVKEANNLVEILVRNAGHMAPADQPKWLFNMINHLTTGEKFC